MRKTIYLRDEDAEVFEEAEALLGEESFSSMLAEAVKGWVEKRKGEYEEFELTPRESDGHTSWSGRPVRFVGRKLFSASDDEWEFLAYQTQGGRIVVLKAWHGYGPDDDSYCHVHAHGSVEDIPRRDDSGNLIGGNPDAPTESWIMEEFWQEIKRSVEGPAYDWID